MLSLDFIMYLSYTLSACLIFVSGFFHILKVLMSLELIVLNVLLMMVFYLSFTNLLSFALFYMIFSVCESILGLSLMILMVRNSGNEYTKMISISKF